MNILTFSLVLVACLSSHEIYSRSSIYSPHLQARSSYHIASCHVLPPVLPRNGFWSIRPILVYKSSLQLSLFWFIIKPYSYALWKITCALYRTTDKHKAFGWFSWTWWYSKDGDHEKDSSLSPTVKHRLWLTKYRRNRINFVSFVLSVILILRGQWGWFWRKFRTWGFVYHLICHLGLLYHYRVSFVRDLLFHF
jgi:hypothetical protein